ncbi:hypothetical protein ZWY2020_056980 [Hordeum vulgare]|nr:hypothetical protein ZWY2020_051944 [Hordeum vulgare]KAI5015590.1 hypothetical protein ZWY2020_056980 [Hordeum vulgare]
MAARSPLLPTCSRSALMTTVVRQQVSLPPEFVSRRVDSPWLPCGVTSIATTSSRRRRRQESRHRQGDVVAYC